MGSLKLSYRDVYQRVAEFLSLTTGGTAPTGTNLTLVQDIVNRGYRKFLMPISSATGKIYRWYFLHRTTTLSVEANKDTYKLPLGFSSLVIPFTHITPLSYNPEQKPLSFIYLQKSITTGSGYPRYFALKTGDYNALTGQQDNVVFSPTPSGTWSYYYTYVHTPPPLVNDDDVFVGDDFASECILETCLAVAQSQEDDTVGHHAQEAERLIQAAIGEDSRNYMTPNLGSMGGKETEYIRTSTIYNKTGTQVIPE